jgi:hypothetical protein
VAQDTFKKNFELALRAIEDLKKEMKEKKERFISTSLFKKYIHKKTGEYTNGTNALSISTVNSYITLFEILGIIKRPRSNVIEIVLEKKLTPEEVEKVIERRKLPTKWKEKYELVKKYILENRDKLDGMLLNDFCAKLGLLVDVAPRTIQGQYVPALKLENIIEVPEKDPKIIRIIAPPIRVKNQQVLNKSGRLIKMLAELYNTYNGINPIRIKHMLAIGMSTPIIYKAINYLQNKGIAKESEEKGYYIDWNKLRDHLNSIFEFQTDL